MTNSSKPQGETFDAMLAPGVPDVIDQNDPLGLLPLSALGDDLRVTFGRFTQGVGPGELDIIELGFQPDGALFRSVRRRDYPNSDIIVFPQTLTVPRSYLRDGVYEVSITVAISGVNPVESARKKITIDTTPPNFNQKPLAVEFPAELNGLLTEAYLTAHGQVIVNVPFYGDVTAKDRAIYFWTDNPAPPDNEVPIREQEFSQWDIDNRQLLITVYAAEIRAWGPGPRYLYYKLRDYPGNTGPTSYLSMIEVDLTPAPGVLPPPRVLLARGRVDRQQARDRVLVEFDEHDFAADNQWIAAEWDGRLLPEVPVVVGDFPRQTLVIWPVLQGQGNGPRRAQVQYRIRTGGTYSAYSPPISVDVNLTLAGQDHSNAPALLNDTLDRLEVWGKHSGVPDTLLIVDAGEEAKAYVELYQAPNAGEVIELFWGAISSPVASYIVKPGDTAGQRIELTIPWSAIEQDQQNSGLPVYYSTSNGVNKQQSLPTPVRVAIRGLVLKEPTFPHANGAYRYLNCCSRPRIWEGVTVRVADSQLEKDDVVVLVWQGRDKLNDPLPIDGTYAELPPVTLTEAQARDGVDIVVDDYENLLAPMVDEQYGLAYYRLFKGGVLVGISPMNDVILNRTMPSGDICSPTEDLCERGT